MIKLETKQTISPELELKFKHLKHMVGNTPMLEILYSYEGEKRKIYVKCEHYNLTGSIKDRMALFILEQAYRQGKIKKFGHDDRPCLRLLARAVHNRG